MEFALFMSRVGAFACAISYEKILAMGLEKLVMFGTCGVLDRKIEDLAIIISTSAIRDEGTSYHYMKPSDEIKVNEKYKKEFEEILNKYGISSVEGKIWTTDAPYRETRNYFNFSMQRIIQMELNGIKEVQVMKINYYRKKNYFFSTKISYENELKKYNMQNL